MKRKYKHKFDRIYFWNRWSDKYKNGDWTMIGITRWYSSHAEYRWMLCFFGFEAHFWFTRILKEELLEDHKCIKCGTTTSRSWHGQNKRFLFIKWIQWTCHDCIFPPVEYNCSSKPDVIE